MEILKQFIARKVFSTSGPREIIATENDLAVQSQAKRQTQNVDVTCNTSITENSGQYALYFM